MYDNVNRMDKHLCCSCGICEGICSKGAISMKKNESGFFTPVIDQEKCNNCGLCYSVCPGDKIEDHEIYSSIMQNIPDDYLVGNVIECFNAKIKDKELRDKCTSGGMVTGIISYLLEKNIYDAAFCVDTYDYSEQVQTVMIDAESKLENTAQSRYVTVSHKNLIRYMLENRDKKIIIVAVGCAMAGIRYTINKFKLNPDNYLCLGLFCACQYSYKTWDYFQMYNKKKKIKSLEFRNKNGKRYAYGMIKATFGDDKKILHTIHRAYIKSDFSMERCWYCTDLLNVYSDISFGDNNTKSKDGESSTIIVRSELGAKIIKMYEDANMFYKEKLSVDEIKDTKHRKKREYYYIRFLNGRENTLYPDRDFSDYEDNRKYDDEYEKQMKNSTWALEKNNYRKLWIVNQLKYLKLRIFKKSYLAELPLNPNQIEEKDD